MIPLTSSNMTDLSSLARLISLLKSRRTSKESAFLLLGEFSVKLRTDPLEETFVDKYRLNIEPFMIKNRSMGLSSNRVYFFSG